MYRLIGSPARRLLLSHEAGLGQLWVVDTDGRYVRHASPVHGPYAGWSATSYQPLPDGTGRWLWSHEAGLALLWVVDANGNYLAAGSPVHGPYAGWSATSYESLPDRTGRLLWTHETGLAQLWIVDGNGLCALGLPVDGPYSGPGVPPAISGSPTGPAGCSGTHEAGLAQLSRIVDGNGVFVAAGSPLYGPYPGWRATSYRRQPEGRGRILWRPTRPNSPSRERGS